MCRQIQKLKTGLTGKFYVGSSVVKGNLHLNRLYLKKLLRISFVQSSNVKTN